MLIHAFQDAILNELVRHLNCVLFVTSEGLFLVLEPREHSLVNVAVELRFEHAHAGEHLDGPIFDAYQVLFGDYSRHVLLVSQLSLRFSGFLLVRSALFLSIDARFCCFESLSFDQLGVSYFFILLLLLLHRRKFCFFEYFHARLLQSLEAEDVKHGLDLLIKVK